VDARVTLLLEQLQHLDLAEIGRYRDRERDEQARVARIIAEREIDLRIRRVRNRRPRLLDAVDVDGAGLRREREREVERLGGARGGRGRGRDVGRGVRGRFELRAPEDYA
jgi:hypothetical protein